MNIDGKTDKEKNKILKQNLSEYLKHQKIMSDSYTGEIRLNISQGTVGRINIEVTL